MKEAENISLIFIVILSIFLILEFVAIYNLKQELIQDEKAIIELQKETDFALKESKTVYDLFINGRFE